jgi:hypothetical protein
MPRNVNPASITVGAGIAPQGTVEDNSLRHPQRDVEPLRAHLLDPNNAHMASAIGIVDAGGYYSSTDVEGALQELGGGGAAGRHNGLVIGGTFTSGPGLLTLDTPTVVLIGGVAAPFGGATVVLPPSVTRYVWIDPTTSTLTASAVLPPVSSEPILIAKVTTDGGANVTSSQDARFFVANLDRKVDYTLRSDGSAVNDASEACFVTLDAALFWLENYVATAQERKALVLVRGEHTISNTVVVPAGVPNIEFRGEGAATFATGAALAPMFNVSGTVGLTFTGITFRCDHAGSTAIRTTTGALACSNVTVQNCRFTVGGSTWDAGVVLNAATPAIQQGHRVLNSQFTVNNNGVLIASAVDCVVRDCTFTGTSAASSSAVTLARIVPNGENCVVENVKVVSGFDTPFNITTYTSTLRDSQASGGGSVVGGIGTVVDGCAFSGITDTTAGLSISPSAVGGAVVSNTSVSTTTVWAAPDNPTGIRVAGNGVVVTGCTVSGFYNVAGNNGAGVRVVGSLDNKVTDTDISDCHTGVEVLVGAEGAVVEGCTIVARVRGIYSDVNSPGTSVANTTISLDATTGLTGIVLEGVSPSVVGCQIKTTRPLNNYLVGEVPAGILCGSPLLNGPYTITGCTFTNFYNTVGQVGGGVVYTEGVNGLSVTGCIFNEGGVGAISPAATLLANVTVTGCQFDTATAGVENPGVTLSVGVDLYNVSVSGCTFEFSNTTTRAAVKVQGNTVTGVIVADCTYRAGGGATPQFVDVVATSAGEGVSVTGNTVKYSGLAPVLGVLDVLGVENLVVANNSFSSFAVATAKSLVTNAKQVDYTGNTVLNMNGIDLVAVNGFAPTLRTTGNTFDGGNDTTAYGIRVVPFNAALSLEGLVATGNTFRGVLDGVRLTNSLNNLSLSDIVISDNSFGSCRHGILMGDVLQLKGMNTTGNHFSVYNHAFFFNNGGTGTVSLLNFSGNTVVQSNFVNPPVGDALCYVQVNDATNLSVTGNTFDHVGDVGAVSVYATNASGVQVEENTTTSTTSAAYRPITVSLSPTASLTLGLSVSRNRITHLGNGLPAIFLNVGMVTPNNTVSEVRMDGNNVFAVPGAIVGDNGVECAIGAGVIANCPIMRGISLCHNTVRSTGEGVRFYAFNPERVQDVLVCHNTSLGPTDSTSDGAITVSLAFVGFPPPAPTATAYASNVTVSHNTVRDCSAAAGISVRSLIPMSNLSVDDNSLWGIGSVGSTNGNINVFLSNDAGAPTYNVATNVSVSRNKIVPTSATAVNYATYAIFLDSNAGVNSTGMNISVNDNEIAYHDGGGIGIGFDYNLIENLSVSGNKVNAVNGQAIFVDTNTVKGLNVSHNLVEKALLTGLAGDATIEVATANGGGFVLSGNRLGTVSRRGIFVNGTGAVGSLDNLTVTGNIVDFTGGAGASEEGLYTYWTRSVYGVTVTGNTVSGAETGIYIDGGLGSSLNLTPSDVKRVAVTGNTVSATNYGVWVSNHTTNSGLGTANLTDVAVTGNVITSVTTGGAMSYGVLVDTVFGTLNKVTVSGNTVDAGTTSTGSCITVDANDAVPTQVSVTDNSTVNGYRGVYALGNGTERFSEFSVCRNRVLDADSIGIHVTGMASLRNLAVDDNSVQNVDLVPLAFSGQGITVNSSNIQNNTFNVSVSGNTIDSTQGQGILLQLLRSASNPEVRNVTVSNNRISNWNDGGLYTTLVPAITVNTSISGANAHALYNLNVSNNNCMNATDDYVSGFSFSLDEKTRQVVFAHNQVLLDNQTNAAAMAWTFTNTGGSVPKDFSFMGNQFRNTNKVGPTYTGATADSVTFYGNIGSCSIANLALTDFWTTFAATYFTTVIPAVIANHNIDDGT